MRRGRKTKKIWIDRWLIRISFSQSNLCNSNNKQSKPGRGAHDSAAGVQKSEGLTRLHVICSIVPILGFSFSLKSRK